jgi:hypothetical protein
MHNCWSLYTYGRNALEGKSEVHVWRSVDSIAHGCTASGTLRITLEVPGHFTGSGPLRRFPIVALTLTVRVRDAPALCNSDPHTL